MKAPIRHRLVVALLAGGVLAAAVLVPVVFTVLRSGSLQAAADTSQFDAGNIIADQVFFASQSMSAGDIDKFIANKGASCVTGSDGTPCLKDFRMDTTSRAADAYCNGYTGASAETAGAIVAQVALSCGISPRVLLVMLQKEQGLLTASGSWLYASRYRIAMGFGCPDTAACDTTYYGFQNQVYAAGRQMKLYGAKPTSYSYRAGRTVNVYWNPDTSCGYAPVAIANQATADLYNYTPYQPNAAALAAGYGAGNACSSYGNRNFWLYFTDWFGSTQYDATAASLPKGNLDAVTTSYGSVSVSGWAFDPDAPTDPIDVHVYVNGAPVLATTANQSRPDVGAVYPSAGPSHGYSVTFPADLGTLQVCTYAINVGAGTVNPQLGCRSVSNPDPGMPVGSFDSATPVPGAIKVSGWAYDQDTTSATVVVRAYVDGVFAADTPAGTVRPDVAAAFGVGPNHGFDAAIATAPGTHVICLYALNVGLGVHHAVLGCRSVDVPDPAAYSPFGSADTISAQGGTVVASGWAVDRDVLGQPVPVTMTVDGTAAGVADAAARPDVAVAVSGAGPSQGFTWSKVVPAGEHRVCAVVPNIGYGTGDTTLGCRTLTTIDGAAASPRGSLDVATGGPGTVSVAGWVYDPDGPTTPVTVQVQVDGAVAGTFTADADRPDVAAAVTGIGPAHGIDWTGPAAAGAHQVCLTARNIGAGSDTPLGCRSVTVADPSAPRGTLDAVTLSGRTASAVGWAFDPDQPSTSIWVHVYVDAVGQAVLAVQPRPDVGAALGVGDDHGWSWTGTLTPGQHQVCAYGINVGPGPNATTLGCRSVTVG